MTVQLGKLLTFTIFNLVDEQDRMVFHDVI